MIHRLYWSMRVICNWRQVFSIFSKQGQPLQRWCGADSRSNFATVALTCALAALVGCSDTSYSPQGILTDQVTKTEATRDPGGVKSQPNAKAPPSGGGREQAIEEAADAIQPIHEYLVSFEETTRAAADEASQPNPYHAITHLGTNYGTMGSAASVLRWENATINADLSNAAKGEWAGMWHSLAGLAHEKENSLDFVRCYPHFIRDEFQPKCVGIRLRAKGEGSIKLEIKSAADEILWQHVESLTDGDEMRNYDFALEPDSLRNAKVANWVVEQPANVSVDELSLLLELPRLQIEKRVFLISYAKLARCYSQEQGVVKDRAHWAVGQFDSVPTSGMFCLATCAAWRLGVVEREFAFETLHKVHATMSALTRGRGLLPHFMRQYKDEYRIAEATEFSTVDTSLYYHAMVLSAQMLGDSKLLSNLTNEIKSIGFAYLLDDEGYVVHGLKDDGQTKLESRWQDWGGETVLVLLLERMALGNDAKLKMGDSGRVYRGRGFIAEVQSLFYSQFSMERPDAVSGVNWLAARTKLFGDQREYCPKHGPDSAAVKIGVYGLSAGDGYRGLKYESHGTEDSGVKLLHPHYMIMAGQLALDDTYERLRRMEQHHLLPPWGLVENVTVDLTEYLPLIGSLNASFESLGAYHMWAAYSEERDEIYSAASECPLTRDAILAFYPE